MTESINGPVFTYLGVTNVTNQSISARFGAGGGQLLLPIVFLGCVRKLRD